MPLEFANVPVRRWRKARARAAVELAPTRSYERLMDIVGRAMAAGGAVEAVHRIVSAEPLPGAVYDVISISIDMPPGTGLPAPRRTKRKS